MKKSRIHWADNKKIAPIQFKTTIGEREYIKEAAQKAGMTLSSFILLAIRRFIKETS